MPEGPSIVILKEGAQQFIGKKILHVSGNSKIDLARIQGQTIIDLKSWGKHFLVCFKDFFLRIHLLMFGSYRINEQRELAPRLSMMFENGQFNFYSCSIKLIEGKTENIYDWELDTMSENWNSARALKSVRSLENSMICDALLDQNIFAGVGNIIKNEALFITKVHPEAKVKSIPVKKLKEIVSVTRDYCFDFYRWKKEYTLRAHWLIYRRSVCPRCNIKIKMKYIGMTDRQSFFCNNCQIFYKK